VRLPIRFSYKPPNYFFGHTAILNKYNNNRIIIEGWLRGVAPWQNGIIIRKI
jgi:L-ascorbate metabolism protein UlaG (beta-lactamase superfamily)